MVKAAVTFFIISLIYLFSTFPVSADWFDTVSGNIYSRGELRPTSNRGGPTHWIDELPTKYFSRERSNSNSGMIYYSAAENTGGGSETNAAWRVGVSAFPTTDPVSYAVLSSRGDVQSAPQPLINGLNAALGMSYSNYCENPSFTNGLSGIYLLEGQNLVLNCASWGSSFTIANNTSVTIFVERDLNIESVVKVPPSSSLVFVVGGSINFGNTQDINPAGGDSSSPHIQGIYITDGQILSRGTSSSSVLYYGGIFIARGGFRMRRVCSPGLPPCEQFIYNPLYAFKLPVMFKRKNVTQTEVAP